MSLLLALVTWLQHCTSPVLHWDTDAVGLETKQREAMRWRRRRRIAEYSRRDDADSRGDKGDESDFGEHSEAVKVQ